MFLLIPFFNLYWVFRAYAELGEKLEYETGSGGEYRAAMMGMAYAISYIAGTVCASIPVVNFITGLAMPILGILAISAFHKEARRLMS